MKTSKTELLSAFILMTVIFILMFIGALLS